MAQGTMSIRSCLDVSRLPSLHPSRHLSAPPLLLLPFDPCPFYPCGHRPPKPSMISIHFTYLLLWKAITIPKGMNSHIQVLSFISLISAPAAKAFSLPVITIACTPSS